MEGYLNNRVRNSQVIDAINHDIDNEKGKLNLADVESYKTALLMDISKSLAAIADSIQLKE